MFVHNISPELFSVGPLTVHWYGLLFVIGIALAYFVERSIYKEQKYKLEDLDNVAIYLFIGLVVGARLGHVVFYNFDYFSQNPIEIFKIWNGGLASHGAAIGVFVAYLIWIAVYKVKFFKYADALVVVFPLISTFVRIGNFINSEIVGIPTDSAVGVVFERLGEDFARHPVQIYSALMNLSIFVVLMILYKKYYKKVSRGFFLFLYMGLYFIGRFIVEFWKDLHALPESFPLSMGQVLSIIPILIAVVYFIFIIQITPKNMAYPANATFKHQAKSSRLWALLTIIPVKGIMLIPHMVVLYVLQIVAGILALIGVFAVLFTGKYPKGIENIVVGVLRWAWKIGAYLFCLTDKYPPFTLKSDYPADMTFEHQKSSSRLWALLTIIPVKGILLIPHFIVLAVIQLIAAVCMILGLFAVLFTGEYPKSFENVITTAMRYQFRINVYFMCLTDKYPPVHWDE